MIGIISTSSEEVSQNRIHHDFPFVCSDQKSGGKMAAQILLERGSSNITLLRGPRNVRTAYERFFAALEVLGQSNVQFQVLNTSFSFNGALETARKLFELYPETDGVIAVNDIAASAVLREALLQGRKIPDEIQIIGFDDIPMSQFLYPALSTIHQPAYEMGKDAAKLLLEQLNHSHIEKRQIILPVSFKERETTEKAGNS